MASELCPISTQFATTKSGNNAQHDYVDLGVSVMWATCNIGADSTADEGLLFAWGDTVQSGVFDWSHYPFSKDSTTLLIKYNTDTLAGTTDSMAVLLAEDDAASHLWGETWRTPTANEYLELRDACFWVWLDDYNGTKIQGLLGISRMNGNTIFFPATTYHDDDEKEQHYGWYWTASANEEDATHAQLFTFKTGGDLYEVGVTATPRCYGRHIRGVTTYK